MAGRGSRFKEVGTPLPKPLISVHGKPMFAWALESLKNLQASEIIFIGLKQHDKEHGLSDLIKKVAGSNAKIILIEDVTEGQLCTVLAAKESIETEEDILIASSDTYIVSNLGKDIQNKPADSRGIISVANLPGIQWSFAKTDSTGKVIEVAEKVRISDYASTGLYYFSSGKEFVTIAEEMIRKKEKTRGEYYIIPVYQKYINRGWRIDISTAQEVWDMGTPAALSLFESHLKEGKGHER